MRICYVDLNVVDCTADPHILEYDTVEKMLDDVLKVCESDVVRAINVVRLSMGKAVDVIDEDGDRLTVFEEQYESDYYSVPYNKEDRKKIAKGDYAKKHKVEGLVFRHDPPFDKITELTYKTPNGDDVKVIRGPLPIGLTGVKRAIEMIKERLKKDPTFRHFHLDIGVVWDEFGDHNCSDYIFVNGLEMTVDYSNQDWYRDLPNYRRHIERLAKVLGVKPEKLVDDDEWYDDDEEEE